MIFLSRRIPPSRLSPDLEHNILNELSTRRLLSFLGPRCQKKWYFVTSLDDFSRLILYATPFKQETSWAHILALQTVILCHGLPYAYYVDSHRIFRFVQGWDSLGRKHYLLTDEASPQWKQVLEDCNVKITYALSL